MPRKGAGCPEPTAAGSPCGMAPLSGSRYCFAHDPAQAARRAKARRKGGHHRRMGHATDAPTEVAQLRDVPAIQAQLEKAVFDTLQLENSHSRNRTTGYLCLMLVKCLEVGEHEARIAALEANSLRRIA